jgi:hypothetical protein
MDEDLQILFQRINKKSAKARQTRLKSLRKLAELLKTKDAKFLDGFVKIFAIIFEKLILSENDAEILSLNQKCLKTILETNPKSIMKSYGMFLPQMLLSCQEVHEEAAKIAKSNLRLLVRDKSKLGKAVLLFCDKFIILLGPLLNNSLSYLKELGCDKDPKVLNVISEKLCSMSLRTLAKVLEYVSLLKEDVDEGFESFRMMLFEESVQLEEEEKKEEEKEEEEENKEEVPKKKKKKKKKKKSKKQKKKKQIKCFDVLKKYPKSKSVRGALVGVLEELFLTKLDEKLPSDIREILIKKLLSSFLTDENVLIQKNFYTRDFLNRIIQVANLLNLKIDTKMILSSVVTAIEKFSFMIGAPFYKNLLNIVKSLKCTQTLNEEFLEAIDNLLDAFKEGFLQDRLGHEVDNHFSCCFEIAEWVLFEKLNLENEGELIFCDKVMQVFADTWVRLYLQRNNPNQKSFLVRGINEVKYIPLKLVGFLQKIKKKYSIGKVNRYRIIEKFFLSKIYEIVKEKIELSLNNVHRARNLKSFAFQFTKNILSNKDLLFDELIPFKPKRLFKAQTQMIPELKHANSSFLSKKTKKDSPDNKEELYSNENIEDSSNNQIKELGLNNDFEMSNWSKTGSDVISLGRSVSIVMRRMSDFSNHLLLNGPVDSQGKIYKDPNTNLLEISFDVVSLLVHCMIQPLEKSLDNAKNGIDFEESTLIINHVSDICLKVLNPLGLIYYRSSAIRGKMETVVDHFVTSIERVFNTQILKHRIEKTLPSRSHLRVYYVSICELFKSLSGFVSLESLSLTFEKMFAHFKVSLPKMVNQASLVPENSVESNIKNSVSSSLKIPSVKSFQKIKSFTMLHPEKAKTINLDEIEDRQTFYALKVQKGKISSITKINSATNLNNRPLVPGESVANNVIFEESEEGYSGKKTDKKPERELNNDEIIISQFGQGSLEVIDNVELEEEEMDEVGELKEKKQEYSNAFKLFHARMFNSMLKEENEDNGSCTAALSRRRENNNDEEAKNKKVSDKKLVKDEWKPTIIRIEEFFNLLTQIFFGVKAFYGEKDILEELNSFNKLNYIQGIEMIEMLLDKQNIQFKKRDFERNKKDVLVLIQSMKDFVNYEESISELEDDSISSPKAPIQHSKTYKKKKSVFFQTTPIIQKKMNLDFNEELFGTLLLTRRFQRIKNLEIVGNVMQLAISYNKPGMLLLSRYFLMFDEKDLFLHRIFLDNIQTHFNELCQKIKSKDTEQAFIMIEASQDSDSKKNDSNMTDIVLYPVSDKTYNSANAMSSNENLLKKQIYLHKMKEEKGISFPLKYFVRSKTRSKNNENFFASLTTEKVGLLSSSIQKFEQKFIIENKSLGLNVEVKRINKISMWQQFWVDFSEYIHSFGISSLSFKRNHRNDNTFIKPQKSSENIIFDLNFFLNELILKSKLQTETLQGILHIILENLLEKNLISRETLVLVSKLCTAIALKNSSSTGKFIHDELKQLLCGTQAINLKNCSHVELINTLFAGFPRADLGFLIFTILRDVIDNSKKAENPKELSVLIDIITSTSSLFQFVSGHQSQTSFWSENIKTHVREAFENILKNDKNEFVLLYNKLLWFGKDNFTVLQFLLDLLFEFQKLVSLSVEVLKEIICRIFKFIFVQLRTALKDNQRHMKLMDFYCRLISSLPLSLLEFQLSSFSDLLNDTLPENKFDIPYEDVTKSFGYLSIFEISAILINDELFLGLNAVRMHIVKQKIMKDYRTEINEKKTKDEEEEESEVPVSEITNHVVSKICELTEVNEVKIKLLEKSVLTEKLNSLYDLEANLDQLENNETEDNDIICLINGSLLRVYSWLLRQNKVDIFSERVEMIEKQVTLSLKISQSRTNSFWRFSCISLLRFIRRVILYIEMFSEEVQKNLLHDVMKLAIDFTKEFHSKSLETVLKEQFLRVNSDGNTILNKNESKANKFDILCEENLSETFQEFRVEVAETISRFSLRHSLDVPAIDIINLLGSSIPQFRKSAFFLLSRSENSILRKKFDLNVKTNDIQFEDLDEKELIEKRLQIEQDLLDHINPSFHKFFLTKANDTLFDNNRKSSSYNVQSKHQIENLDSTLDLLFVSEDIDNLDISSSSNKVLEASVVKFEKKMLPQLLFWSVLLRLASNEWETVVGDHISHFLVQLFDCNSEQYFYILERVFLYARFRQSQMFDLMSMSSSSEDVSRKPSTLSMLSNVISDESIYLSPDVLLESCENISDSELCTAFTLNIIFMFANSFPKTLRKFVSSPQKKKLSKFAEHIISLGISQSVFKKEVSRIIQKKPIWESEEFMVSYYMRSQEIIACLIKDETTIQLNIQVPANYPLKQASVSLGKGLKLPEKKALKWLLMMKKLLVNHNVAITDALGIWKQNIEKQFSGIEPCPICYYVVQFSTKNMPSLACRTCRSKFHPTCINKWFQTSSKAECPMCKSQFI